MCDARADRRKDTFLATLSHELRNPLAPIRNALAIMGVSDEVPMRRTWAREVIERQTSHLTRLVDDLLDVSRITSGKLRLHTAPLDLNTGVQRAIESSGPLIDQRRHRLHVKLSGQPVMVNGDMTRLIQVVLNLLNNAAKYTPEGGDIWVEVDALGGDATVRVRDNGSGIAPHMTEAIFDVFAQGERTLDRSEGGLGVGLTLARRIVNLHGGNIAVRSAGRGTGAEFVVTLPRLDLDSSEARPVVGEAKRVGEPHQRYVLVVDDNVDAAKSMAMLLRMHGQEVDVEERGGPALERIGLRAPDVMLLDIGLPDMSGYDVAREARLLPNGDRIRIFALTGYGQEEDRRRSLEAGFDGHLVKPVAPDDLIGLIAEERSPPLLN
jgi:CheY-like chemotaxis protein/two-component sensor histidine kinase